MTKGQLGFMGVDIGDGMPLPVREEDPTGDPLQPVGLRLQSGKVSSRGRKPQECKTDDDEPG